MDPVVVAVSVSLMCVAVAVSSPSLALLPVLVMVVTQSLEGALAATMTCLMYALVVRLRRP